MTRSSLLLVGRRVGLMLADALVTLLLWIKALILVALVLAPIVISFMIGVLFAVVVRMAIAAREGFKDGQRLING